MNKNKCFDFISSIEQIQM